MTGSMKWFIYETDGGDQFAIHLDESNTEATNLGVGDLPPNSAIEYALPRNVRARYAVYADDDLEVVRKCTILTAATYGNLKALVPSIQDPVYPDRVLTLQHKRGENVRVPKGTDARIDDGDED